MTLLERPPADEMAPERARNGRRNVVAEIAERRRADVRDEMARLTLDEHLAAAEATPPPRDLVGRLAAPGLHLIAEIKRSSPTAGEIAAVDEDIVARARAYERGGAHAVDRTNFFVQSNCTKNYVRSVKGQSVDCSTIEL